jgi:hypothetical protein
MELNYYNRYGSLKGLNSKYDKYIPFVKLTKTNEWKRHKYLLGVNRLDVIAQKYYSDPNLGWLILLANRGKFENGNEFKPINDDIILDIPYPKNVVLNEYSEYINKLKKYY